MQPQRIDRVRRRYNQWVANETLEDYALRFTAKSARRWSAARVANTALGSISFLALEAIGGTITLHYGVTNATAAILCVSAIIFLCGVPIAYYAARHGLDIDLLTRGAGFGYIGSTITSLIYASFTFIFFALEAVILAMALELCLGIPRSIGYLVSALAIIPLVTHGITLISRFQLFTQPLWIILHLAPFVAIAWHSPNAFSTWAAFPGLDGEPDHFDLVLFGSAAAVVCALIAQIGEQVDFLRFLPEREKTPPLQWWLALLAAGPGWIVVGAIKLLAGSFLAYFALSHGVAGDRAAEPTQMYLTAFGYVFADRDVALVLTGLFVILSQLKINVTNAYAGSIAWSNFFSRLTHSHPGRVVWLVFNVVVAVTLMEIGIYKALEQTLALYSNVAIAWVGAIVADLTVNKPLGLRPAAIEFKRAYLYDVNPVGVGAMTLATLASVSAFHGLLGPTLSALAPFVALGVSFVAAPAIAALTRGRYYLARQPEPAFSAPAKLHCCICENAFEPEDMAPCPAYSGPICSLCCSLDARCHDLCKPHGRLDAEAASMLATLLPKRMQDYLTSQVGRYLGIFIAAASLVGLVLGLIYLESTTDHAGAAAEISNLLWKVFFALALIIGVVAWLFVLAQDSRRAAEAETQRQTSLLRKEIAAHEETDRELQRAKDAAEAANHAKSRYVVGLSHELRSPLNAISGYAQLLENDAALAKRPRDQVRVIKRSADHLSGLIDGILDISKIEAGRLHLSRDEVPLADFLEQLVGMFRLQAQAKGISFFFERPEVLPAIVHADEKRLRQILINLLSNAVKFTASGAVRFIIQYRSPVAEFIVRDTGPGIAPQDLERIFYPFERGSLGATRPHTGTGLGLTISKALASVMGGDISVASTLGTGTEFHLKLLLSEVYEPTRLGPVDADVTGYEGPRRTVIVTDDDPAQRDLLEQVLRPRGFIVLSAGHARDCLDLARTSRPDLFILDIQMPDINGWELAEQIRAAGHRSAKILIVSASALEAYGTPLAKPFHDAALIKPIDIPRLLATIGWLLDLRWSETRAAPAVEMLPAPAPAPRPVDFEAAERLIALGRIGHIRAIQTMLDALITTCPQHADFITALREDVDRFDLAAFLSRLTPDDTHALR